MGKARQHTLRPHAAVTAADGIATLPQSVLENIIHRVPVGWRQNLQLAAKFINRIAIKRVHTLRIPSSRLAAANQHFLSATFPCVSALSVSPPLIPPDDDESLDAAEAWGLLTARHVPAWAASLASLDLAGLCLTPEELHMTLQATPALTSLSVSSLWISMPALAPGSGGSLPLQISTSDSSLADFSTPAAVMPKKAAPASRPSIAAMSPCKPHTPTTNALCTMASLTALKQINLCAWQPHDEAIHAFTAITRRLHLLQHLSLKLVEVPRNLSIPQSVIDSLAACLELRHLSYEGPPVKWLVLRRNKLLTSLVLRSGVESLGNDILKVIMHDV